MKNETKLGALRERMLLKSRRDYALTSVLVLSLLGFAPADRARQADVEVRLQDNSDWWSTFQRSDSDESVVPEARQFARANFMILGVNLGEDMFRKAATKLGKATIIQRGDASMGRRQACYTSPGAQDKLYVIFERGEVEFTFYLFADGPAWEGSDRCVVSDAVSRLLTTASGLHLGESPSQVIAILGNPTKQLPNELVYSFLVKKKTSSKDLERAKREHHEMTDKDLEEAYGFYTLGSGIEAKFANSKLTYLAVSKAETN